MKKKNIILMILIPIFLLILIVLINISYPKIQIYNNSQSFLKSSLEFTENNAETIFSIDKITYFSSCDANISTNSNSAFTISNLYQYTDIAIFINQSKEELTAENTLNSVSLDDIQFSLKPTIGQPNLYYKNIEDFATSKFSEENLINNSIKFETTSNDTIDYSTPVLYNNCANPITLCYVNSSIKDEYTLSDTISSLSYNGSLLKTCGITLNSISCKLSFVITIINNNNETFKCPLNLTIPLSTESSTIYSGSLTLKDSTSYRFIKQLN